MAVSPASPDDLREVAKRISVAQGETVMLMTRKEAMHLAWQVLQTPPGKEILMLRFKDGHCTPLAFDLSDLGIGERFPDPKDTL